MLKHLSKTRAALAALLLLSAAVVPAYADVSAEIVDLPRAINDWGYNPSTIRVNTGEWVTWSNNGVDVHTVTDVKGAFDSGQLLPSEGYSVFFDQSGTYDYFCTLHDWMKGRVVVAGATPAPVSEPVMTPDPVGEPMMDETLPELPIKETPID
jgi:plastocyanin